MPDTPDGAAAAQQEGGGRQNGFSGTIMGVVRMIAMWWLVSTLMNRNNVPQAEAPRHGTPQPQAGATPHNLPTTFRNAWRNHETFHLDVYLSANATVSMKVLDSGSDPYSVLAYSEKSLTYDWNERNYRPQVNRTLEELSKPLFEHARNNGTVWAHAFFTRVTNRTPAKSVDMFGPDVTDLVLDPNRIHTSRQVNVYQPPKPIRKYRNLLEDSELSEEEKRAEEARFAREAQEEALGKPYASYWQPTASLRFVHDFNMFEGGIPAPIAPLYQVMTTGHYLPPCYFDEFWQLKSSWIPLNSTIASIPINFSVYPTSLLRAQLARSMLDQAKMMDAAGLGQSESQMEEVKRMLLETDPWLIGLMVVVSTLHMIFDFLAFHSDIDFWRKSTNRQGLSFSSIVFNAASSLVIFLYLLDNDTTWMVILSSGIEVLIGFWKITKSSDRIKLKSSFPFVSIEDLNEEQQKALKEIETKPDSELSIDQLTDKYDRVASRYLSYLLIPIVIGYSVYSLVYETHKSWYSWIIGSLVSVIYMFGFITMLPQLYLNYKLKSVAHLPWKMLTFKALNTFIDDIFAFIIKMPTLHRLACFRDDVVFLIFLYQKWVYRTDYSRVNEFGVAFDSNGNPIKPEGATQSAETTGQTATTGQSDAAATKPAITTAETKAESPKAASTLRSRRMPVPDQTETVDPDNVD